ncbi:MAG TPA: PIN domain-containing protein [Chloroflexota bacterium]|nr:PIN domain-containing protein [Chloroflexota bacterium]
MSGARGVPDDPDAGGAGAAVPFVDTDVLIRFLTGDDPQKQAAAASLLERVEKGEIVLRTTDTVIADAVFVLASPRLYRVPRDDVRDMLAVLVRLPGLEVDNRSVVLRALDLFAEHSVDFGDAMIVASMRESGSATLYSYDADFDRMEGIRRLEPGVG